VDSKGDIYTAEVSEGKRVQKFVLKGAGSKVAARKVAASQ
jgi:hypothetical protein